MAGKNEHNRPQGAATMATLFSHFAQATAAWTGHPLTFLAALLVVLVWIVTFLMVFLIQNTQNRDMMTVQLKLSELVLAMKGAENKFAAIEDLSDEELEKLHEECHARAEMTLKHLKSRRGEKSATRRPRAAAHRASTQSRRSRAASS